MYENGIKITCAIVTCTAFQIKNMIRLFTSVNIFKNVIIHVYKTILQVFNIVLFVWCFASLFLLFLFFSCFIQNEMIWLA